ncbi:helix-turn-helix domain-containing protein [Phyllobacteriaceae bacterium JZ32]
MDFNKIEEDRLRLGISQRDLCRRAGIHYMTYSSIKNDRQTPNLRTIHKLAQAIGDFEKEAACS